VTFAAVLVVPIVVGLAMLYGLLRLRLPPAEASATWWRFAKLWTPMAVIIIVAAELIWH
jgi:hypothetical protein